MMINEHIPHVPAPLDHSVRARESRYGRTPKDQRGNRDARKRGRILASLYGMSTRIAVETAIDLAKQDKTSPWEQLAKSGGRA